MVELWLKVEQTAYLALKVQSHKHAKSLRIILRGHFTVMSLHW